MKPWNECNDYELKLTVLRVWGIGILGGIVIALLFFHWYKSIFVSACGFIGVIPFNIYHSIIVLKRDWLDDKICLFDEGYPGISYQGVLIILAGLSLIFSLGFFGMGCAEGGIYSGIGFALAVWFPGIIMLLRLDVYKNENSRLLGVEDENGNIIYKQVIGYHPVFYYLIGITWARGPLGLSIFNLLRGIFEGFGSFEYNLLCFIISLALGILILSPDIMNKILPFEIKTFTGLFKYSIFAVILICLNLLPMITEVYNLAMNII